MNQLEQGYSAIKGVRHCAAAPQQNPWGTGSPPRSTSTVEPAALGTADYPWSWVNWSGGTYTAQGSYGFNMWCYSDLKAFPGTGIPSPDVDLFAFVKESAVVSASKTPLFADSVWVDFAMRTNHTLGTDLYDGWWDSNPGPIGLGAITIARHGGKGASAAPRNFTGNILPGRNNVGFLDGHAEAIRLNDLKSLYWNKLWPR